MNKKSLKRFLSVVLSLSMVLSVNTVNFASEVTDIANSDAHVHEDAAEEHMHEWVLQETVTPATCLEDGVGVYACEGCEETEENVIPATKHSYEAEDFDKELPENFEVVKEASCTEEGVKAYTCTNEGCTEETEGHVKEEEIPAAGHVWENGECTVCHQTQNVKELGDTSNGELKNSGHQHTEASYEAPVVDFTDKESAEKADEPVEAPAMSNEVKQAEMFAAEEGGTTTAPTEPTEPTEPEKPTCKDGEHVFGKLSIVKNATCTANGIGRETCQCEETSKFVTLLPRHAYQKVGEDGQPVYKGEGDAKKLVVKDDYKNQLEWVKQDCVTGGRIVYTCTDCSSSTEGHTYDEITEPLGHDWGDWVRTAEATCVSPHKSERVCKREGCGEKEIQEGKEPAVGAHHYITYTAEDPMPATCTEPAKTGIVCEYCNTSDSLNPLKPLEGSEALGHSYETNKEEDVRPGLPEGENIPKLDKNATPDEEGYVKATCLTPGHEKYTCDTCGEVFEWDVPALAESHVAGEPDITKADCENNAIFSFTCKICGESMGEIDAVDYYLQMHGGEEDYTEEDAIADAKGRNQYKSGHTWEETPIEGNEATCTEDGISKFTCGTCGASEVRTVKAHHSFEDEGHNLLVFDDYSDKNEEELAKVGIEVVTQPTCTQAGVAVGKCTVCGERKTGIAVPSKGHKYDDGVIKGELQDKDACIDRIREFTCTNGCGNKITEVVPATIKHTPGKETTVPATCTEYAKKGTYCDVCGTAIKEEKLTGTGNEPTGHSYQIKDEKTGEFILDPDAKGEVVQFATCTDPEKTSYTCTHKFGETGNEQACDSKPLVVETKAALGHNKGDCKKVPRTHEKNAQIVEFCTRVLLDENGDPLKDEKDNPVICGYEWPGTDITEIYGDDVDEEDLKKAECEWELEATIKEATCTERGTLKFRCSMCGEVKFESIAPHHAYMDDMGNLRPDSEATEKGFTVVHQVVPTCQKTGMDIYTCTKCKESDNIADREKIVNLDKEPHKLGSASIERDFVCQEGKVVYNCTNSGCEYKEYGATVPAQPHQYVSGIIEPTCTSPAMTGNFCKFCKQVKPGDKLEIATGDDAASATGHDFEGKANDTQNATEVTDINGNKVWIKKNLDSDADFKGEITTVDAKCGVPGSTIYKCGKCKAEIVVEIEAEEHEFNASEFEKATCSHPARLVSTCSKCDEVIYENVQGSEIIPDAHVWELDKNQENAPTCKNQKDAKFTCAECGAKKTDKIAHTWPEDGTNVTDVDGSTVIGKSYTCKVDGCGATKYEASKDGYAYCDACDNIKQVIVNGAKAPGCEEVGYTGKQICKGCGKTLKESEEIKATGHDYRPHHEEPNCGPGRDYEECEDCHDIRNEKALPPKEDAKHDFTDASGNPSDTCKVCSVRAITMGTSMQAYVEGNDKKVKYTATIKVANPEIKVISRGLLYYTASAAYTSGDLTLDMFGNVAGVKMYEMASTTAVGATKVIVMTSVPDRTIYGRAYLMYEDKAGNRHTVYGDMASGSFNSLTSN